MKISVIIPTFNEETHIGALIDYLRANKGDSDIEVVVVDGNSTDRTAEVIKSKNVLYSVESNSGRAHQLNKGAQLSSGEILYFVHADTFPPSSFTSCIKEAIVKGHESGCCAYTFNSNKVILRLNNFITQLATFVSGGGDQTLFVTRKLFYEVGGFNPEYVIMEDFELTRRLKKKSRFTILKSKALVSARKYNHNSYLRVNVANSIAMIMFWTGTKPQKIHKTYKSLIRHHNESKN